MRKKPLLLSVCGLAILAGALLAGRAAWMPDQDGEPRQETKQSATQAGSNPAPVQSAANPHARPVAPDVVAIPPIAPEALVRVDPREPLSPFGQPLPPKPKDNSRIRRPLADAAGRILGAGVAVTIAGVGIVEPEQTCPASNGSEWPCGMRARTAFRGFLRGRAVACDIPPEFGGTSITTACTLGKMDIGRWIVANGWGHAEPGGDYVDYEKEARADGKGIFGTPPAPLPPLEDSEPVGEIDQ